MGRQWKKLYISHHGKSVPSSHPGIPWCAKNHRTPTERKWYEVNAPIYNLLKINARPSPVFPGISTNHSDRL